MRIKTSDLLRTLDVVQCAVAQRETVEQSKCFCFQDGQVYTYDGDIMCQAPSGLNGKVVGAVSAKHFIDLLRKLPDADLDLEKSGGELILKGKRKLTTFMLEEKVSLPLHEVDKPGEWSKLPDDFAEAVAMVQECATNENLVFSRTCVHITPRYMQAYDNLQMIRYKIKTNLSTESVLLRKNAIKHIASLGATEFSETGAWIHFRNSVGLVVSCRLWLEEYPDISPHFKTSGDSISIPKGLEEVVDRAQVFTQDMADANRVRVEVKGGRITISGLGILGRHEEYRAIKDYTGSDYAFFISPKLLTNMAKNFTEAELTPETLIVRGPKWTYLAALTSTDDVDEPKESTTVIEEEAEEEEVRED